MVSKHCGPKSSGGYSNKMNRHKSIILFLVILGCFAPYKLLATTPEQNSATAIKRKILAIYNPKEIKDNVKDIFNAKIHRNMELPLNHLGLYVDYITVSDPLPSVEEMKNYRGIITWFEHSDALPNANLYCRWLDKIINNGLKVAIIGHPGIQANPYGTVPVECQKPLAKIGFRLLGHYSENPFFWEIQSKNAEMVEYERKIALTDHLDLSIVEPTHDKVEPHIQIKRKDLRFNQITTPVLTSSVGGYIHPSFALYQSDFGNKQHYRINPFLFLEKTFQTKKFPKPDTNTINGKRIFYSHIDGDGIFNISKIDNKRFSGEIILSDVLKKYKNIPITVSFITGHFDLLEFKSERVDVLYKEMLGLPHIQVASHGYAHPLIWKTGKPAIRIPRYKFSAKKEIHDSVLMIRQLLIKHNYQKPVDLFLWTGDCLPTKEQIATSEQYGLLNMNGGDTRYDTVFDSRSFIFPLGLRRAPFTQIYSSNSNENTYTNKWEGPFYGYRIAHETFANTEAPKRLKPINIYYHFYAGETHASLKALKETYDYAIQQDIFATTASRYAQIAKDFFSSKLFKIENGYRFVHSGPLRTLRFDNETRYPDFKKSTNIIGYQHFQGSLYIHLNDQSEHSIVLAETPPERPSVKEASFWIKDFNVQKTKITLKKQGWLRSSLILQDLPKNKKFKIETVDFSKTVATNNKGELVVDFDKPEMNKNWSSVTINAL